MSEWQPIDTAPKDGTRVLVYHVDEHIPSSRALIGLYSPLLQKWCIYADDEKFNLTHWMHLPNPPIGGSDE